LAHQPGESPSPKTGHEAKKRPSGHDISEKFKIDNGAAIPPNLIAIPNTESNSFYLRYCEKRGFKPHPARYPAELPEYFVRMLTDPDDLVLDPFAGSCVTGEVCERTMRRWICIELLHGYCEAALGRFVREPRETAKSTINPDHPSNYYRLPRPGILWNGEHNETLPEDGGRKRRLQPERIRATGSKGTQPVSGDHREIERSAYEFPRQRELNY